MKYSSHPRFDKKMTALLSKHAQDDGWLLKLQNLLTGHFDKRTVRLGTNVLAPVGEYKDYKLWKVYMAVGGMSKKDCPRVCLARNEQEIIFLCFGTHIKNYKTKDLISEAKGLLKEFIGEA